MKNNSHYKLVTGYMQLVTKRCGYSLIEVLIAAGIFASVMAVVFATFSVNSNLSNQSTAIREASVSGRYAVENIAREFRLASNYSISETNDAITIKSYDSNGQPVSRQYFIGQCNTGSVNNAICLKVDGGAASALTSSDINITGVGVDSVFDDKNSSVIATMQPILQIKFKITANVGKKKTETFTQSIETAVAGRSYFSSDRPYGFDSSIPVENQNL